MNNITPRQLNDRLQQGEPLNLLDVRAPAEHAEVHVDGVRLVPLGQLEASTLAGEFGFTTDWPLYIFCRSGNRARQAADKLEKSGYAQCHVVEGGTMAWVEAGLPVIRGTSKVISLERQVRIAAGAIVVTGVVLAYSVNPAFIWLSAMVGAGLIVTGITGWCGMGMLLAMMPWNQAGNRSCCATETASSEKSSKAIQ